MLKYATAEILDAEYARPGNPLMRTAHRVTFNYVPKHGMLYVRSRMISSRCNDNFDEFPADEIRAGWPTFLGKPVFVNHHNDNHRRARGLILDAALHEDRNPDGTPDIWVEGLMEVDALRFPKLAAAVVSGDVDRTSMGVDVAFSVCAACNNRATTPLEYCAHIPGQKGRQHVRVEASTGRRVSTLIRERCHGLRFFENSLLVEQPADPTAYTLGNVELGPGLEHLSMSRTASRNEPSRAGATFSHAASGQSFTTGPAYPAIQPTAGLQFTAAGYCPRCESADTITTTAAQGMADCFECGAHFPVTAAGPRFPNPGDHPFFKENPVHHENVLSHWHQATDDEKASGKRWYADAGLVAKALGTLHHGEHPAGNTHLAAGMLANYSPQTGWAANQHNAARAIHNGQGIGGKGSGIFASDSQRKVADRLLSGEHHTDVMKSPKVSDFAHLIEHGGDANPDNPHVVVDRHALSVAAGKRMSDDDYGSFPKTQRHYYGHVVGAYHQAAKHLSDQTGEHVAGHMVQATTWLVRQRLNQQEEAAKAAGGADSRLDRGREKSRTKQEGEWGDFKQKHLPGLQADPGTGYTKESARGRRGR